MYWIPFLLSDNIDPLNCLCAFFVSKTKSEHSFLCMDKFAWTAPTCVCVRACMSERDDEIIARNLQIVNAGSEECLFSSLHIIWVSWHSPSRAVTLESRTACLSLSLKADIDFLTTRRLGLCSIFKSSRRESLNVGWGGRWENSGVLVELRTSETPLSYVN